MIKAKFKTGDKVKVKGSTAVMVVKSMARKGRGIEYGCSKVCAPQHSGDPVLQAYKEDDLIKADGRGGARAGAGRKKVEDPIVQVWAGVRASVIKKHGGLYAMAAKLEDYAVRSARKL